jgi:hypothetical protein
VSFPCDGNYAVILQNWTAPDEVRACAGEPFSELGHATALEYFDSVQLISAAEYELVPEPGPPRTLVYLPDSRRFQAVICQLKARPAAVGSLMKFAMPE